MTSQSSRVTATGQPRTCYPCCCSGGKLADLCVLQACAVRACSEHSLRSYLQVLGSDDYTKSMLEKLIWIWYSPKCLPDCIG